MLAVLYSWTVPLPALEPTLDVRMDGYTKMSDIFNFPMILFAFSEFPDSSTGYSTTFVAIIKTSSVN